MSAAVRSRPVAGDQASGGAPARRAVIRWAWRMFRREWRQQAAVLGLLIIAVAAATAGIAFAADAPGSPSAQFGTANHMLTVDGSPSHLGAGIAATRSAFGRIEVIEHAQANVPGSVNTIDVRAQQPGGVFSAPMLRLDAGHYPAAGQVAVTSGVAAIYRLHVGGVWREGGATLRVVGIVENPGNLQDEFALLAAGQIHGAGTATILFDATARQARAFSLPGSHLAGRPRYDPGFPPVAVLLLDTIALLFIGLIAVAGFTVMAQRRLRALGMLAAVGATDRHVRLVLLVHGAVIGAVAAVTGTLAGLGGWIVFVPRLETIAGHRIDPLSLPWWEVAAAMLMAVLTAVAAAWWPARAAARVPVVAALSGRPPAPKQGRRFAALGGAILILGLAAISTSRQGKLPPLIVAGLVCTATGVLLLGPIAIGGLASLGRRSPVAVRLALRDLARYSSRSGAALAAISLVTGIVAAIAISAAAAQTGGEAGWTNLPDNQLMIYLSPGGSQNLPQVQAQLSAAQLHRDQGRVNDLATTLRSHVVVPLDEAVAASTPVLPEGQVTGRPTTSLGKAITGPHGAHGLMAVAQLYVATPALLRFYKIDPAAIEPGTEVITSLNDLSGMKIIDPILIVCRAGSSGCPVPAGRRAGGHQGNQGNLHGDAGTPTTQEMGLPRYSSAPNSLLTAHAMKVLGLHSVLAGWLIQAPRALTTAQVSRADHWAAASGLIVETTDHSAQASLSSVADKAIAIAVLAVLAVLGMTVGLIRSETAGDLRVLAATGAGGGTRRLLTGTTAAALALLGAVLGTAAAYLGIIAWNRGIHSLAYVPVVQLAVLLVGLPLAAFAAGWLLTGREPRGIARQPLD